MLLAISTDTESKDEVPTIPLVPKRQVWLPVSDQKAATDWGLGSAIHTK